MNLFHVATDTKRFSKGTLPPLALLVILLLPLLFGGIFVWAYWNPVGNAKDLPVALVNSDRGAHIHGDTINAGQQITTELLAQTSLDFHHVSADQARQGVTDGTYYFAIEIPEDFSQAVASSTTADPHRASLNATFNNSNGQLAMTIGNMAVEQIIQKINEQLGTQVVGNLLIGFSTIGDGMNQAATGAGALAEGADTAHTGAGALAEGANTLAEGIAAADQGAGQLAAGADQLYTGLGTATTAADSLAQGLARLNDATARLGSGAGQISAGVESITTMASGAATAQEQALITLVNLSTQLRALGATDLANTADATIAQLRAGQDALGQLDALNAGAKELHRQLTDPAAAYTSGMNAATSGAAQLAGGLHTLEDGAGRLVVGTRTLTEGTSQLVAGSQQLTVGANQLASGLVELDAGAGQLALRLQEGAGAIPTFAGGADGTIAQPAEKNYTRDTLGLFGMGLAPIFTSLGLYMGTVVMFMLLSNINRRAVDAGLSPLRAVLTSYLPAAAVGLGQATLMFAVQHFLIGLHAPHPLALWATMCAISLVFVAVTHCIMTVLGVKIGRPIAIAFMALQITSSGGIYPVDVQPRFFQWAHPFDPMTYSTNLLRGMVYGLTPGDPRPMVALGVLAVIAAGALVLSSLAMHRQRQWRLRDLRSEIHM